MLLAPCLAVAVTAPERTPLDKAFPQRHLSLEWLNQFNLLMRFTLFRAQHNISVLVCDVRLEASGSGSGSSSSSSTANISDDDGVYTPALQ